MKKPYIKKLDEIANIAVWIVDAQYVRGRIEYHCREHPDVIEADLRLEVDKNR